VIIGSSHSPAPFLAPEVLGIATAAIAVATNAVKSLLPTTSLARAWQEAPGDLAPLGLEEEGEEEELVEQPQQQARQAITLRIGVFFDGTGNNLANAAVTEKCRRDDLTLLDERTLGEVVDYCRAHGFGGSEGYGFFTQTPDNSYGNAPSNVARLFDLYKDDATRSLAKDERSASIKAYLEGIGTSSGEEDSVYGQGTGMGDTGVVARVMQSPQKIQESLGRLLGNNPNLEIEGLELDIFGFSRGAAAARHFANEILKSESGILASLFNAQAPGFNAKFDWATNVQINFIGLFDTVAAVADPLSWDFSPADHHNPGVNLYLPPNCARKVLQLKARDEMRWNFALNSVAPHHQEITALLLQARRVEHRAMPGAPGGNPRRATQPSRADQQPAGRKPGARRAGPRPRRQVPHPYPPAGLESLPRIPAHRQRLPAALCAGALHPARSAGLRPAPGASPGRDP